MHTFILKLDRLRSINLNDLFLDNNFRGPAKQQMRLCKSVDLEKVEIVIQKRSTKKAYDPKVLVSLEI